MDLISKTDKERELIANELYHIASQTIYSMILGIKMVLPLEMDDKLRNHLLCIEKNSTESLNRIRELAFKLHPIMIKDLGLLPTLRTFIEKINREQGSHISFQTKGNIAIHSLEKEVLIYRLCTESLTHFSDYLIDRLEMVITFIKEKVIIEIQSFFQDNIDEKRLYKSLSLIKTRAETNHGNFLITFHSNKHTTTIITIPNEH